MQNRSRNIQCNVRFVIALFGFSIISLFGWTQFTSVGGTYGVNQITTGNAVFGHAVSIHDFNGDGLDDISFGTTAQIPQFYQNTGTGFVQVSFGLVSPTNSIKSILWVDLDNDGDKDLFLSHENSSVRLYENTGNMTLVDITFQSGLAMEFNIRQAGAGFGDFNNDGFLDLYLCKYYNSQFFNGSEYENKLYRNNGDLTFTDVTVESNASVGINASFMPAWFDYNEDGWQDIFIVNDRIINPNFLLRNNGDGTFTDVAPELGMNVMIDAMGFSMGDFNNDLEQDIFMANSEIMGNYLYKKSPDNTFQDIAAQAGVLGPNLCWSGLWMDFDNNGLLDLHVATELYNLSITPFNYFFVNNGNETFIESAAALGLAGDNKSTWATAQGDWNMDGYPDFVSHNREPHPSYLWQNQGGSNNYFAITLEGTISNRDAIGSTIYCYANGSGQMRYTACGENYLAQDSGRKIFGLGQTTTVDSLIIHWLSGTVDKLYNISANQTLHIVEGSSLGTVVSVEGAQPACPGTTVILDAGSGIGYLWNNGQTSQTIAVTEPGTYNVLITKDGYDVLPPAVEVSFFNPPIVSVSAANALCYGQSNGTIELFNMGGTGLTEVIWTPKGQGETLTDLPAGEYQFVYVDANGCATGNTIIISQPDSLVISEIVTDALCAGVNNGSIELMNENETGMASVVWSSEGEGLVLNDLAAGEYSYVFTDSSGCISQGTAVIAESDTVIAEIYFFHVPGEICLHQWSGGVTISGGSGDYEVVWQFFDAQNGFLYNEIVNELEWICQAGGSAVNLVLTVTDSNGCTSVQTEFLDEIVSVLEVQTESSSLFPNPVSRGQTVVWNGKGGRSGSLYSIAGSLIWSERMTDASLMLIPTSTLTPGVYLLTVETADGPQIHRLVIAW